MLKIEVTINNMFAGGETTARILVINKSNLADISNYDYFIEEDQNEDMNIPKLQQTGHITNHKRKQGVWNLVMAVLKDAGYE